MGFIPIIGMAMQAGGAIANHIDKKKTEKAVGKIRTGAQHDIDANTAQATRIWDDQVAKMTPEAQDALQHEQADKRMAAFEQQTGGVADATNVIGEGAPQIVKADAARQLGDKLAEMKSMMQARSRLGGWDDRGLRTSIGLNHSGQDINRLGSFSRGTQNAAEQAMEFRSQQKSPVGDILMGAGSMMTASGGMMGGGGLGAMFGGAGGAGGGAPSMIPANTGGSSLMPATKPGFNWDWMTTPWGPNGVKLW